MQRVLYIPGGSLPLAAVPDPRQKKKRGKGICFSGVGVKREKGVKITDFFFFFFLGGGEGGYLSRYDQSSKVFAIIRGKGI